MSTDWLDSFGIRGSKLDPFTHLTEALAGRGVAAQSAERMATTLAQQLVGERLDVSSTPRVAVTVERISEVRPPPPTAALPTGAAEMPLWSVLRGRVREVVIGALRLDRVDLSAQDISLVGSGDRVRVGSSEFEARVDVDSALEMLGGLDDPPSVRLDRGRIEVSDARLARWFWMEISIQAKDQQVCVDPIALRFKKWEIPMPARLRRQIVEEAPELPAPITIDEVGLQNDDLLFSGTVGPVDLPIDMTKLMAELGTGTTRSILRIAFGA